MTSTIIPCLRYRDAPRMIEWLCQAFGFERHLVVEDGKGGIAHAQLTLGPGMIMLGTAWGDDDPFGRLQSKPAGAEIVIEIKDEDYGGRVFSCRAPEGHLWNVGSYDPWKAPG